MHVTLDTQQLLNITENLLTLRRRLMFSQKEMINAYFLNDQNLPIISVPTLSNIENGSTVGAQNLANIISKKAGVDFAVFLVEPDVFAKNIDLFFKTSLATYEKDDSDFSSRLRRLSDVEAMVKLISEYLMEAMINEELRPGSKIPSDRELSILFSTGRNSVREALKVLSTLGLITILPGKGTFIASSSTNFFILPLTWTLFMGDNNTENLIDVRNVLEVESARLAAKINDKEAIVVLAEIYRKLKTAYEEANFQTFLDLDLDFHLAIAACSHNPIIINLLTTSRKLLSYISKSGMVSVKHLQDIFAEHGEIYSAIIAHDPDKAKIAMEIHLTIAKTRYTFKK